MHSVSRVQFRLEEAMARLSKKLVCRCRGDCDSSRSSSDASRHSSAEPQIGMVWWWAGGQWVLAGARSTWTFVALQPSIALCVTGAVNHKGFDASDQDSPELVEINLTTTSCHVYLTFYFTNHGNLVYIQLMKGVPPFLGLELRDGVKMDCLALYELAPLLSAQRRFSLK